MHLASQISNFIAQGPLGLLFFLAAIELRSEVITGKLLNKKAVLVPLAAAIGGMIIPASIYLVLSAINHSPKAAFGIPLATDLPLALALIALLPKKISQEIRVFILALAIFDDLLTILILLASGKSESLAAVIGVAIGLLTPKKLELPAAKIFTPVVNYLIIPIFLVSTFWVPWQFNNTTFSNQIFYTILLARVIGKPIGIYLFASLAMKKLKTRPLQPSQLLLSGLIGIMGLSVATLFTNLTTQGVQKQAALLATLFSILAGAFFAYLVGFVYISRHK